MNKGVFYKTIEYTRNSEWRNLMRTLMTPTSHASIAPDMAKSLEYSLSFRYCYIRSPINVGFRMFFHLYWITKKDETNIQSILELQIGIVLMMMNSWLYQRNSADRSKERLSITGSESDSSTAKVVNILQTTKDTVKNLSLSTCKIPHFSFYVSNEGCLSQIHKMMDNS